MTKLPYKYTKELHYAQNWEYYQNVRKKMHFSHTKKHFLKMHQIFLHFNRHFSVDKFNIIDRSNQVGFIPQNKISMIVIYLRVIAKL